MARERSVQLTVKVTPKRYEELRKLAVKENTTIAELVRGYIDKGLSVDGYVQDISFLRSHIREELAAYLTPQINRIIKIVIKTGLMGVGGFFLLGEVLQDFVPTMRRKSLEETIEKSKKKAAIYLKVKDSMMDDVFYSLGDPE